MKQLQPGQSAEGNGGREPLNEPQQGRPFPLQQHSRQPRGRQTQQQPQSRLFQQQQPSQPSQQPSRQPSQHQGRHVGQQQQQGLPLQQRQQSRQPTRPLFRQPQQQQQEDRPSQQQQPIRQPSQQQGRQSQQQHQQRAPRSVSKDSRMDVIASSNEGAEIKKKKRNRKPKRLKQTAEGSVGGNQETHHGQEEDEEDETPHATVVVSAPMKITSSTTLAHLSETSFDSLSEVSPVLKRALREHLKFERMTVVQASTFPVISTGKDVLAKAKTGTGKTVGFLLHILNSLIVRRARPDITSISALILSPTRELACQIEQEAKDLLHFAGPSQVMVECVYGGYNVNKDISRFSSPIPVDILVATPGRLEDLLGRDELALRKRLGRLSVLIMDEADQLLELGFRPAIERIIKALPTSGRQTLLFTATVPKSMLSVVSLALKKDFATVDCVGDEVEQTHASVDQHYVVCPFKDQFTALENLVAEHCKRYPNHFKIICFLPTARQAQFFADLVGAAGSIKGKVLAIHSRKSQSQRTRTSEEFKAGTKMVLFSSDVSARGMDYPDVTLVIQVGLVEKEQYIHRVGRTARAGARGEACWILDPCESFLINSQLGDVPLKPLPFEVAPRDGVASLGVRKALASVADPNSELHDSAEHAYQAFLGFYNSHLRKLNWTREELVQHANDYALVMGLEEIPFLMKKTVGMMNLKGVSGLRIK